MVASISSSEFSELITSVHYCLRKKLNIELKVIRDLSSAVKSYKDDPENLMVLQSVVKLIFDIYDSGKVLNEATSNTILSLLADCIMGTFNSLKKNDKECETLCNEIINLLLVMSQKDAEAPNLLLKYLSNSLIAILIYPKFDTKVKRDFLKVLNYILENSDRPLRYKLRNYSKLEKLWKLLYKCGDYDFQVNIIETIFRYTSTEDRKLNAKRWFRDKNGLISAFLNILDFEPDCRKFLNLFNCSLKNERLVYSIPCQRAIIGNCEIQKPEHPSYEEFWVDFNIGSKSLSLVCSQASLYSNSVLASQISPGLWETILIESHIIKKVHLRQISLPMGSQGAEENIWALQLTLFHPCYAIFSSVACNFEGNLCMFMFSTSDATLVNTVLQPIFGINYFSDMASAELVKKSCKSSVSSLDLVYESDQGQSVNRDVARLPKYPFKMKVSQSKEFLDNETSKNCGGSHVSGNKITQRMANDESFKENIKGTINTEKSSNLTPKSKKQKSPYKPLEFINSSNLNKESNESKKVSLNYQISSVPQSSELTIKDIIKEKPTAKNISCVNKNNEECIDKVPAHDYSKGNQRNLPYANSCGEGNKENCVILAEDTDENSEIMKDSQSKAKKGLGKALRNVKSSEDDPLQECQGRILRSHVKAQILWDTSKSKTSKKEENNVPPINSLDGQISKMMEIELNDSDSDEWLKIKKRKSTGNKQRAQSLGILHMKQLHNKEVAMEKAIKKKGREKAQSLKPTHNSSRDDNTEPNLSKKKLFNNKDKSFLGYDGEKVTDKEKIMDSKVASAEKDDKSVSSINWFSENDSEASWMKPGYKSGRFDSCIKEGRQFLNQSKSKETCNEKERSDMQKKDTNKCRKFLKDNVRRLSGVKRDINSCSVQVGVDERNSKPSAGDEDNSRLQENKRRKTVENDGMHKKKEIQDITESKLSEEMESGLRCVNSNQNKFENENISDTKRKKLLKCNRKGKVCNESEPNAKSGSKEEANFRHESSFQSEFHKFSESENRSVLKFSQEEMLDSRETSSCIQNRSVSKITENHMPSISKDTNNVSINGKNNSSQNGYAECSKETFLSNNLNSDNEVATKETIIDCHKNNPLIMSSKQDEGNSSSEENVSVDSSNNMDSDNDQEKNHSEKHSDANIIPVNSKADSPSNSVTARSGESGKSTHNQSSDDNIEGGLIKEQHHKIILSEQVSDLMETQRKGRIDKGPDVMDHSEDDNSMISEKNSKENEDGLNSDLSKSKSEAIVSLQINQEISLNENHIDVDKGMRIINESQNSSPDIILLSGIKSSPKTPESMNDGEVSNLSPVMQANIAVLQATPKVNVNLSCSIDSQKNKSIKAKKNSLKESVLRKLSEDSGLDAADEVEDLILIPESIPTDSSTNFREKLSQKLTILGQNDSVLRGKTVQTPEKEDNHDLQEILSASSLSLKNFASDLDLDVLSLTGGNETEEKQAQNNSKSACSNLMFNRADKNNQISVRKRTVPSKRHSDGARSFLIENKSENHKRNSMDTSKRDTFEHNAKSRRDLNKNISSPIEINKDMFADTSWDSGKAFNEIQEYDSNTDDLPQDVSTYLTTRQNSCQKEKVRNENNINSSKNSCGIQSRKRRIREPENIGNRNSKIYQYDLSSFENTCNFNINGDSKKGPLGDKGDNISSKQEIFESENIPDLHQILMIRFEEKTRKMKELGNLLLKHSVDGMESLKESGHRIGNKSADEYLKKLRDEISAVEEAIHNSVKMRKGLEKCLKHISETISQKANVDSSAIERLKKTHLIAEDMHVENKKVPATDYIEMLNLKLSSKIKQLHYSYMRMEWKKELAKVQNQLKLFLHV